MPIENRNLKAGTKLVARYHKQPYSCEVMEGEGGKLRYRLADGREFKSPSAAGMAITGHACDGWVFWNVETANAAPATQTAENAPAETAQATQIAKTTPGEGGQADGAPVPAPAPAPAAEQTARAKSPFFKLPNQKGAPEGQVRWYCRECKGGFLAPTGTTPEACPQGHRAG